MKRKHITGMSALVAAVAFGLSGCTLSVESRPAPTTPIPTVTRTVTVTPTPPVASTEPVNPMPPATTTPSSVPTRVSGPTIVPEPKTREITLYFVGPNDHSTNGDAFGCVGDRLFPASRVVKSNGTLLETAVKAQLAEHHATIGASGLHNPLAESRLQLDSADVTGAKVVLHLSGTLRVGGMCDDRGIPAQIKHTAMRASGATTAAIYVNGVAISKLLSASGK